MGRDLLDTAEQNYDLLTRHLQRIRDLTEQAANGTYSSSSLKAIQSEINSRLEEISRIASNAEFNGIKLMSVGTASTNGIDLQIGLDSSADSVIKLNNTLFSNPEANRDLPCMNCINPTLRL
jgi:flagellin